MDIDRLMIFVIVGRRTDLHCLGVVVCRWFGAVGWFGGGFGGEAAGMGGWIGGGGIGGGCGEGEGRGMWSWSPEGG